MGASDIDVYIGGSVIVEGSHFPSAGYWKNGKWTTLCTAHSEVTRLVVSGNDVYACGFYLKDWELGAAGYWKNSKWIELPSAGPEFNCVAKDIAVAGSDVYVVGFRDDGKNSNYGYWRNGTWTALNPLYLMIIR